nr:2Fe-2S iron-sulfur cluster-binding protein [Synechococcus sp. FACHB-909]
MNGRHPLDFRQNGPPPIAIPRPAITIAWPDGRTTTALPGQDWLEAARQAAVLIPTGCLGGSCGACEIEVNGRMVRACVATVPSSASGRLTVSLASDPHW